eukprot:TRINITY_DN30659_c0_g1_i1.p1 TRINITY_DN30659_c0_g1~~TRINITY_DN30659_c0_g1_i1.p1  ORF type:complete len:220 (+),score=82.52 TRINITY_DN30659_c0_g1_i1:59-661(+)
MPGYQLEESPEQAFLSVCKAGDLEAVQQKIADGADPNQKGYILYKNRLLGLKHSQDWGKFIVTHQSGDRMMGSALHYAVMAERHEVCAWLLANGADAEARLNTPPHMPHEASVLELAEANGNAVIGKMALLFKMWCRLPWDAPPKKRLLEKLPEEVAGLKEQLIAFIDRKILEPPKPKQEKADDSDDEFGLKKLGLDIKI